MPWLACFFTFFHSENLTVASPTFSYFPATITMSCNHTRLQNKTRFTMNSNLFQGIELNKFYCYSDGRTHFENIDIEAMSSRWFSRNLYMCMSTILDTHIMMPFIVKDHYIVIRLCGSLVIDRSMNEFCSIFRYFIGWRDSVLQHIQ